MQYCLGRIGPCLSDRILISPVGNDAFSPRVDGSCSEWALRICRPDSYDEENRRSIQCFKQMIAPVGQDRLQRIYSRYNIDLEDLERNGSPLLSRTIAKISVGLEDVTLGDMEKVIEAKDALPSFLSDHWKHTLNAVSCAEELSAANFAKLYDALGSPSKSFPLPPAPPMNGSGPTECFACLRFDPFLADRERLTLQKENPKSTFAAFVHDTCVRTMRRQMEVGTLMPAPNRADGTRQFYRVAARLITGEGFVSYCLVPATQDTDLKPIQFFRGTSTTPAEVDSFSSLITDLEPQIGRTAWESSKNGRHFIKAVLPPMEIVAGHSLGSTLAQMDLVKNSHIRKAYLFSGPGLSDAKIANFNQRMARNDSEPVDLEISDADRDDLSAMGYKHIGYQSPEKVTITYRQYSAMRKVNRFGVHTMIWSNQKFYGVEGGHSSAELDAYLDHKTRFSCEWLRQAVGPYLVKIFRIIRDFCRWVFGSRTTALTGLQIGTYVQGPSGRKWQVQYIRPQQMTKALAAILYRS